MAGSNEPRGGDFSAAAATSSSAGRREGRSKSGGDIAGSGELRREDFSAVAAATAAMSTSAGDGEPSGEVLSVDALLAQIDAGEDDEAVAFGGDVGAGGSSALAEDLGAMHTDAIMKRMMMR